MAIFNSYVNIYQRVWFMVDITIVYSNTIVYLMVFINQLIFNGHFRILDWRYLPYIRPIFQALISGNIPTKYEQAYGTNVPPF